MGRGEDEPAPDATMLIGDEVLWGKEERKRSDLKVCAFKVKP